MRSRQFSAAIGTFQELPHDNVPFTSPGGYTICHRYQYQDDEETNTGTYVQTTTVESWEDIPHVVENMLNYPESGGFTISITIEAVALDGDA
jgi:hypothetical protein